MSLFEHLRSDVFVNFVNLIIVQNSSEFIKWPDIRNEYRSFIKNLLC